MFDKSVYIARRDRLKKQIGSGVILFLGNDDSPMNYSANVYHFRQDSSFLYFFGLDYPGMAAVIDIDEDTETIFANDLTIDDIVWTGPQPTVKDKSAKAGISDSMPFGKLESVLKAALRQGRPIHFLPQYRADNVIKLTNMLGIHPARVSDYVSEALIRAVVAQREIKSDLEVAEIEKALAVTYETHTEAMRMCRPGMVEREVAANIASIALANNCEMAYPIIFSVRGETLHNHYHGNVMQAGQLALNDSGVETAMHYASDITRTFPVNGKFTPEQRDIYNLVLDSEVKGIEAIKPGVKFRDIHLLCSRIMMEGLKDLGFFKGNIDDAMEQGAFGIFFQCGVGHQMGLDVHDMEGLGEQFVGYDDTVTRSKLFGLCYLRMAKAVKPGYLLTVEPGIYFIPELMDRWRAEKKFADYINYDQFEKYKSFGGIRIEDNVLVTENGYRILGKPIPKTIKDVENMCAG